MNTLSIIRLLLATGLGAMGATRAVAALSATQADAFVRDYYAVYTPQGVPRLMEFYSPDATLTDPTFELDLRNRDEISNLLTKGLAKYASLEFQVSHSIIAGDDLIVEGTMVGKLRGKTVRVRFASIFHFTNGKISAQRDMFDTLHFYEQLGIDPFQPKPAEPKS